MITEMKKDKYNKPSLPSRIYEESWSRKAGAHVKDIHKLERENTKKYIKNEGWREEYIDD